jgi:SNF2 family DNA or RNA helicase
MRAKKVFIADQVGLGKTPEAIASIETAKAYPAVVSCPPSLVLNWKKEIERFAPQRKVAVVKGRKEFPEDEHDFLVIGDANLDHWKTKLKGYKGYVFDESHRFKNFEAKRTKAAILIAKQAEMVLLLTGTPITNRPAEYAAQLKVLGRLSDFGGKWPFYKRYANAFRDNFGQWNIQGASHLEELNRKLRGTCYIRRTKDQVLDELPEIRRSFLYVEPSAKVMKEYRKAEADIASFLAMRAAEIAREIGQSPQSAAVRARIKAEAAEHLVRLSTLRRLAALAKIEAVEEWAKERVENEEKVVLAAHHRAVVDAFADAFGAAKIQGGMKAEEVEAGKEDFQERDQMVMVLSIQAGGTGHTLTAAKELGIVELPWTPADVEQTEGRVHRKGQTRGVLITTFVAEGTIDEQMVELLDEKRAIVEASIEGETTQQLSIAGDLLLSFLP